MNIENNAGKHPDDELKHPSILLTESNPNLEHGFASFEGQQEAQESQLIDLNMAGPPMGPGMLEVERRVHAIAHRLIEYLGIEGIDPSSYPNVIQITQPGPPAYYNPNSNVIGLSPEVFLNGFIIGEEVSHWLHERCLLARSYTMNGICALSQDSESNAREFIGYIGRELSRRACADSDLGSFFDPNSESVPMSVKEFRRLREQPYRTGRDLLRVYHWNSEAKSLIENFRESVKVGKKICSDSYISQQDLSSDLVREIITATSKKVLAAIERLANKMEDPRFKKGFEEIGFYQYIQSLPSSLNNSCANLLSELSEYQKAIDDIARNPAEELDLLRSRNALLLEWFRVLLYVDDSYTLVQIQLEEYRVELMDSYYSRKRHLLGYEAGAIWLERTADIRKTGATLFDRSPEELYAKYLKPLEPGLLLRAVLWVAVLIVESASPLFGFLRAVRTVKNN